MVDPKPFLFIRNVTEVGPKQRERPVAASNRLCLGGKQLFQWVVQSRQVVVVTKLKMVEALKELVQ